jgi:tetratricopeptide (TPR) repeat protein
MAARLTHARELAREVLLLTAIALSVQAFVFSAIFPGYFAPWWPHHEDFYMPLQIYYGPNPWLGLMHWPRPLGISYLKAVGSLGVHGSIVATIAVVLVSSAITAIVIRTVTGIARGPIWRLAFAAYAFLLFSHPRCYFIYTWDMLAQISYLFIALALLVLVTCASWAGAAAAFVLMLCAFLAKETYALSLIVLVVPFAWFRDRSLRMRAFIVGAPCVTFAAGMLIGHLNQSPFTGAANNPHSPYEIVLTADSITSEWLQYAAESATNYLVGAALIAAGIAALRLPGRTIVRCLPALLVLAGVCAWLPHSVLPNHHFDGYTWNGAYLYLAPVLMIPRLWAAPVIGRVRAGLLALLAFASPALSIDVYHSAQSRWYEEQESIQHKLLATLDALFQGVAAGAQQRILVTGVNFAYSPFGKGFALNSFPNAARVRLDVLEYRLPARNGSGIVRFVTKDQVDLFRYDSVWAFANNGSLILAGPVPQALATAYGTNTEVDALDRVLYPELLRRLPPSADETARLLRCGATLLDYAELSGAEKCLLRLTEIPPASAYAYYYLGLIREKQGNRPEARRLFERAVALDDPRSRNPWFATKAAEMR